MDDYCGDRPDNDPARHSEPKRRGIPTQLSVAFLLLPDFTLAAFAGFLDVLRMAGDEADGSRQLHCRWTVLGADRTPVRSSCGVEVAPWEQIGDPGDFDYIVVVGGLLRGHAFIDRRMLNYLRRVDERGGSLIGICTGSFALARAGLMRNHRCCVHWFHLQEFVEEFPDHQASADRLFIVSGRRITCAGGQGAVDLAVHLVELHFGRGMALKVTALVVVSAARGPKHPQPHPELGWFRGIKSGMVQRAVLIMEQHLLAKPVIVRAVASKLGISAKTLTRGFQKSFDLSPSEVFRAMRVAHCRWELLNTDKPSSQIALDHGFSDAAHFTRVFRRYYGTTPMLARRTSDARGASDACESVRAGRHVKAALKEILWGHTLSQSVASSDWTSKPEEHSVPRNRLNA
jgi:transcriptional regulator GlxA family with amidase domain